MITVVGDVMADVVARHREPLSHGSDTPASVSLQGGGAAGNVAAWLRAAGVTARLVARVGEDALARVALGGLRCAVDTARPTGVCVVLVGPDGERTMLPDPGACAALDGPSGELAGVVYVSGYALLRDTTREAALAWLAAARSAGALTVVDPASAVPLAGALDAFSEVRCDVLLPNAAEAAVLGDRAATIAREVVVKRGAAGATWCGGARTASAPAPAVPVVDTTGAGDAFAAGLMAAWPRGRDRALEAAVALATRAVGTLGGRPAA